VHFFGRSRVCARSGHGSLACGAPGGQGGRWTNAAGLCCLRRLAIDGRVIATRSALYSIRIAPNGRDEDSDEPPRISTSLLPQ
jgi:hypothetical protein